MEFLISSSSVRTFVWITLIISQGLALPSSSTSSRSMCLHQCNVNLDVEFFSSGDDPVYSSQTPLLQLYSQLKSEVIRLESMKEERMVEVRGLKKQDEELCCKLSMDPFYISSTTVPTSAQLEGIKDHIKRMEELKFEREEQFITTKNSILSLYTELEEEPASDIERMIACEDTEHFTLSASNLSQASDVLKMLKDQVKKNQKEHMLMVEKLENLYERLRLDMAEKYKFLSLHQGHGKSVMEPLLLQ